MTTQKFTFMANAGAIKKGSVFIVIGNGSSPCETYLTLDPDTAERFARKILAVVDEMPRHREGSPADLGCEVL